MDSAENTKLEAIRLGLVPVPRGVGPDASVTDPEKAEDLWTLEALVCDLPHELQFPILCRRVQPLIDRFFETHGPTALDSTDNLHLLLYMNDFVFRHLMKGEYSMSFSAYRQLSKAEQAAYVNRKYTVADIRHSSDLDKPIRDSYPSHAEETDPAYARFGPLYRIYERFMGKGDVWWMYTTPKFMEYAMAGPMGVSLIVRSIMTK